ncbi:hypothetical protein GPECTOR_79g107 [Gonium pectorale]|uniref:Capsule synthesis protein CapA domain-containing protein n=1 Tax=Gonium pectorale TaxID=33097 RepID=A0A150G1W4_GONPE|nr:hypothetical protein GPECTOR_79g107 [Gonium pectorale]|eukprot:KXZ43828.1 hypothetical protein GPECTOR_79g107 [Gonium pectorale]
MQQPRPQELQPQKERDRTVRLLLTGDVMLGRGVDQILPVSAHPRIYEGYIRDARDYVGLAVAANGPLPARRGPEYPWGIALADMAASGPDVRLINLETAVTTHDRPWPHKGINYRMHPGNVRTLAAAGVTAASLANNHSLDWCERGLLETLDTLEGAAGVDLVHGHSSHHAKGCELYRGKLIVYGAGDLISDYEGIHNASVESAFPREAYRDDVGLLWYADVGARDGALRRLAMRPTRLRHLRLEEPDPADWEYIVKTMDRECRRLGAAGGVRGVRRAAEGEGPLLLLDFVSAEAPAGAAGD